MVPPHRDNDLLLPVVPLTSPMHGKEIKIASDECDDLDGAPLETHEGDNQENDGQTDHGRS